MKATADRVGRTQELYIVSPETGWRILELHGALCSDFIWPRLTYDET